ncbi:MAG: zinc-binding alcohol dehydrogenase [Candidatus Glassbacteria bacterium]
MPQGPVENRVFYYTAPKQMVVKQQPCPSPGPGEIRCRSICSLVSIGTEMISYGREVEEGSAWDAWIQYPFEPGYSSVGEVVDIGAGVESPAPGDIVCSTSSHRAWFIDRPDNVHPVPSGVSPEEAAWFCLDIIVQNGIRESRPEMGETAVVIGLGPLGQLAVRLLGLCGLENLVAVDPLGSRCELAGSHGPTETICSPADKAVARVRELTDGRGADLVFDITGHPAAFHAAQHMLRRRGRLGLIGDVPRPGLQTLTHDVVSNSISIVGAHGACPPWRGNDYYRWGKRELTGFFFRMIAGGRIKLGDLTTHRIAPERAPEVYADIYANRSAFMGVIVDWAGREK